jgi:hypothetical protein
MKYLDQAKPLVAVIRLSQRYALQTQQQEPAAAAGSAAELKSSLLSTLLSETNGAAAGIACSSWDEGLRNEKCIKH